jgi:hypothetical protein
METIQIGLTVVEVLLLLAIVFCITVLIMIWLIQTAKKTALSIIRSIKQFSKKENYYSMQKTG